MTTTTLAGTVATQANVYFDGKCVPHTLTLADTRTFTVQFAPGECIAATPIARPELPASAHPYVATVRLIEV